MIRTHRAGRERESRAGEGAAQVVVRVAVAAGKVRTGEPENLVHLGGSPTLSQQVPRDPPVDDAPIGLRETFADVPALQAALGASGLKDKLIGGWQWNGIVTAQGGFPTRP
jgi:hypothetical protein